MTAAANDAQETLGQLGRPIQTNGTPKTWTRVATLSEIAHETALRARTTGPPYLPNPPKYPYLSGASPVSTVPSASAQSLLSARSQEVVRATASVVAQNAEKITACFYPRMFAAHPELLQLFNQGNQGNQATGEQSRALAGSVVAYAVQLIDPDAPPFHHVMQRIAHKHISLGIRPEQYTIVGHHLLAAVAEVLGDAVTPEIAAAWDEVYWLFRHPAGRAGGPAVPAGRRRPGAPAAPLPGGPAHRGDR